MMGLAEVLTFFWYSGNPFGMDIIGFTFLDAEGLSLSPLRPVRTLMSVSDVWMIQQYAFKGSQPSGCCAAKFWELCWIDSRPTGIVQVLSILKSAC